MNMAPCDKLFEVARNRALGQRAGLSKEQVEALDHYTDNAVYNELEKAVITFAEQLTRKSMVNKAVIAKLKESLTAEQLVKLAAAVGEANWTNRFNNAFDVELP